MLKKLHSRDDAHAWAWFVRLYAPLVHRWVGSLGIQEPDRSDVAQDVFVALLDKMPSFQHKPGKSFRSWLRAVTLNKCRDLFRRKNRTIEPVLLERIETAEGGDPNPMEESEYRSYLSRKALQMMRECFSETTWRACWAHVVEGRSAREIASELNVTENAVYLARARVLKRLRVEMDGLWDDR